MRMFLLPLRLVPFLKDLLLPQTTDTRFFAAQIQIPIPNKFWDYKGFVFCKNSGCLMKNMNKGLTVPK